MRRLDAPPGSIPQRRYVRSEGLIPRHFVPILSRRLDFATFWGVALFRILFILQLRHLLARLARETETNTDVDQRWPVRRHAAIQRRRTTGHGVGNVTGDGQGGRAPA